MRCSNCGSENPAGKRFCGDCGVPLANPCPKCGAENPSGKRFCGDCGVVLAVGSSAVPSLDSAWSAPAVHSTSDHPDTMSAADGERKTVTALFADIKGSTELMEELDPEEARAIIDPALKLMIDAVHRYDGYVVQSTGDGIFALFGAPVAHEDHPQRALHAAIATRDELYSHGEALRMQGRRKVEIRIGINTGEVVMRTVQTGGHTEYAPVGHVVNLAARMQTIAPPGGIIVSEDTRRLVEGYFELRGLGPTEVKGVSEPVNVYEVAGRGLLRTHFELSAQRGLTKFVGRERELEQMKRAFDLARAGHGQLIAVVAEAGSGKSRLFYEFKTALPSECKLLEAYSVSHGKASAWLPVLELLRGYFGIKDSDDPPKRREKVAAALAALGATPADTLSYLLGLLGIPDKPDPTAEMDPQIKRLRTQEAIKRIILRESLNQPLVVMFEDLHWIDAETQALLDLLADSIANSRVLLLFNYRPEYRHEWGNKSTYSQLRLDPLDQSNADAMLVALLGDNAELAPLKRTVIERTGGNPFFIEEMVQALFDEGALVRNGAVKSTRPLAQLRLPPTVQGILAARIDRLPADEKELLQTLAVIGRESPFGLIRQVVPTAEVQLARMLADLRAAEFVYEQLVGVNAEYIFKHALTQQAAYESLLIERRKQIHEHAGQALESMFAGQLDDHVGELAHHYGSSDNIEKAVEYLGWAGQQALQRSAQADAINSLGAAIDLLQKLPDNRERLQREMPLQLALGQAFIALNGWAAQEVERAFTRARDLCERLGDRPELFHALFGLWSMHHVRGRFGTARERARQLLRRAQSANDPTLLILAHYALGETSFHTGELVVARENLEMMISLIAREPDRPPAFTIGNNDKTDCMSYASWALWFLGYPDQALERGMEAIALAESLSHPFSKAAAEVFLIFVRNHRREASAVQDTAERVLAYSTEHGFTLWVFMATIYLGAAMVQLGRAEDGVAQIRKGLVAQHAAGADILRSEYLCMLAEGYSDAGHVDDALNILTEALAAAEQQDERYYESEIHRLKGELLLRRDQSDIRTSQTRLLGSNSFRLAPNTAEAKGCFERAIEIARNQSGKSLELRATMSLARLLAGQGKRNEASTMLADIYNWFTEGFDTADLKEAKALLEELGGTEHGRVHE
jgi:class 3 adenylate cyclase/predicted ATPase